MTEVFSMIPAPARTLWVFAAICALMLGMLLTFGYFASASRFTRFEISDSGLSIRGTLYGRAIPWSSLRTDEATTVDLGRTPELQPRRRTNGIGMPGYRAGWFRLRNRDRALIFLTEPSSMVAVPTNDGYTLLLSVAEPDGFVRSLQRGREQRPAD